MLKFKFRQISPVLQERGQCVGERCGTECTILDEQGTVVGTGNAYLRPDTEVFTVAKKGPVSITESYIIPGDNFSRPLGRKISAGRAIRSAVPRLGRRDKVGAENRRLIWEQLFLQSPKTMGVRNV